MRLPSVRAAARLLVPVLALVRVPSSAAGARADDDKTHARFKGFRPYGKKVFEPREAGPKPVLVYYSQRATSYLLRGTPLKDVAVLLVEGSQVVATVPESEVVTRADQTCDLKPDAKPAPLGNFQIQGNELVVDVEGLHGALRPAPPLLGWHKAARLLEHTPEYEREATTYVPDAAIVEALRKETRKIQVFVFFGSWCPTCNQLLGRIIRLEREVTKDKPNITFDYYGLPPAPDMYNDTQIQT